MSKGVSAALLTCAIALAGCGSHPGKVAMVADGGIPKGIVRDGLYVNAAGVPLCPVTGAPIAKGEEVGKAVYRGVEYHFCCAGCPDDFKANPAKFATR
ncbi:MAG TPA: YHS domain-containing protein [Fimbriimonadaceae bacterium]|nr:YHS domain-containing protein [Fimbriimonadaceae bacterium]